MTSPQAIGRSLGIRRAVRAFVVFGFYGCLAMGLASWAWAGHPLVRSPAFISALVVLGFATLTGALYLRRSPCPRCGHPYAEKVGGRHRNNFTSECLNCGLRIDAANASSR